MKSVAPRGWRTVTPRLIVRNPRALVQFLLRVFEAEGRYNDEGPTEVRIGDSIVMVSGTGVRRTYTALLYIYVRDVDATYRRAMSAGARSMEKPADLPYGDRRAMFADRWGNTWQVAARLRRVQR